MATEKIIPNYIFERRLHRTLNAEYVKLNALLVEHVRLLKERMALMADVHAAVEQRWANEEQSTLIGSTEQTEREEYPERPSLADYKDEDN
jgi:hypothetical protein